MGGRGRPSSAARLEKPIKAMFFAPFKLRLIVVDLVVSRLGQRTLWQTTAPGILVTLPARMCGCLLVLPKHEEQVTVDLYSSTETTESW